MAGETGGQFDLRLFESMVDHARDAVVLTEIGSDGDPRIVYVNRAFTEQTGYTSADVHDRHPGMLVDADTDVDEQRRLTTAVAAGEACLVELRHLRRDGSMFWVENSLTPLRDASGRVAHVLSIQRDITSRKDVERALRESENRYRTLAEHSSDVVTVIGADGEFLYTSPAVTRLLGHATGEAGVPYAWNVIHPDDVAPVAEKFIAAQATPGVSEPVEFRALRSDGTWLWVEGVANNVLDNPDIAGMVVTIRDITDRRRADAGERDQAAVLSMIAAGSPLTETLDVLARRLESHARGAMCSVVIGGDIASEVAGGWAVPIRTADDGDVLGALVLERSDAGLPDASERAVVDRFVHLAAVAIEHARATDALAHRATHDLLTGLPDRSLLMERLVAALSTTAPARVAVLVVDFDRFKRVNDTVGHAGGDAVLVALAGRLRSLVPAEHMVARFGGDEFVVLARNVDHRSATDLGQLLVAGLDEPTSVGTGYLRVGASIGVALSTPGITPAEILQNADAAMYAAKEAGRGRVAVFEEALRRRVVERLDIERDLDAAIADEQFELHYQPIVTVGSNEVVAVEALVRWRHPTRGVVGPDRFIAIAEETGKIGDIGRWVLQQACRDVARWRVSRPALYVSVNVAMPQLYDPKFALDISTALTAAGVPAEALMIEVTESMAMEDPVTALLALGRIRAMGVRIAIDDFGTGHSSLDHLRQLPADTLKIDRSFVAELDAGGTHTIAGAVISLAHALGLQTVAEGVETPEQLEDLRALGCDLAQGYLFSKPKPVAGLEPVWMGRAVQVN